MKNSKVYLAVIGIAVGLATTSALGAGKPPADRDGDGYNSTVDCNDNNASINPGATEVCGDNVDNNCNGQIDENCSTTSNRDVIVVANNDLGMHCACPGSEYFMLLPPFNTFRAQVIQRGGQSPVVLDDPNDIRVEYDVVENTEDSLRADPYYAKWMEMMPKYGFGSAVNAAGKIQGLTGATLDGQMQAKTGEGWWEVVGVPIFPDVSSNSSPADKVMIDASGQGPNRNPYLTVRVNVIEQLTNKLLATTNTVAPVAFGGCCGCHLQVTADNTGITNPTPKDSFDEMGRLHARNGGINIAQIDPDGDGKAGPVRCSVCHLDPAMGESVPPGGYFDANGQALPVSTKTFSEVLHGWHVQNTTVLSYEPDLATSCYSCHPGNGVNCYRGSHVNATGGTGPNGTLWCSDCHGDLNQRVASEQLKRPWSDFTMPSCTDCHSRTGELTPADSTYLHLGVFGKYLNSRGHKNDKILCTTCHGSPHALYPSTLAKDNEQVVRLQGLNKPIGVCNTCHVGKSANYGTPAH